LQNSQNALPPPDPATSVRLLADIPTSSGNTTAVLPILIVWCDLREGPRAESMTGVATCDPIATMAERREWRSSAPNRHSQSSEQPTFPQQHGTCRRFDRLCQSCGRVDPPGLKAKRSDCVVGGGSCFGSTLSINGSEFEAARGAARLAPAALEFGGLFL
jgi:hypothetical protein